MPSTPPQTLKLPQWDLSAALANLDKTKKYTSEDLAAIQREYLRYLALRLEYPETPMPMSSEVDPLWHAHILCTRDYVAMCRSVGRSYIHHSPLLKPTDRQQMELDYEHNTLRLYRLHFGEPDLEWWPRHRSDCDDGCESDCA